MMQNIYSNRPFPDGAQTELGCSLSLATRNHTAPKRCILSGNARLQAQVGRRPVKSINLRLQSISEELTDPQVYRHGTADNGKHQKGLWQGSTSAQQHSEAERFDWLKAWYPVIAEDYLPTDRPTAVRLFGNAIVLWKDGEGKWRAFQDLCPHRLVPLSEGRVEDGELMCSYHGWRFRGGDGRATDIPQADDERSLKTATESRRSCCTTFPCEVKEGLIWVYASSGPGAAEDSKNGSRAAHPGMEDPEYTSLTRWFMRDLPYGADVLMENFIDPSHVPFAHHGVQGNRFKVPKTHMRPLKGLSATEGFSVKSHTSTEKGEGPSTTITFSPPTLMRYQLPGNFELVVHSVPTDPGACRILFSVLAPTAKLKGIVGRLLKLRLSKWFLWTDHFERNAVLDGDSVFLAEQDLELHRRGREQAPRSYYMPASMDSGVRGVRDWLARHAQQIPWSASARPWPKPGERTRQQMLDRFEQHTRLCPSCSAAHKVFSSSMWIGIFGATFLAAYAAFAIGNSVPLRRLLPVAFGAAFACGASLFSLRMKERMEYMDYRHPDH